LIVHCLSLADARRIARFDAVSEKLAASFWPGPLTWVLPKQPGAAIADIVTAGLDTVAVRIPSHPIARALLEKVGRPLAAPSANRSGHVSATEAGHVAADLPVTVLLDAGPSPVGLESTILAVWDGKAALLRPGAVAREAIEAAIGHPLEAVEADPDAPSAPGMLTSHYAPRAGLRLDASEVRAGEALLAFGPKPIPGAPVATVNLSPSGDLTEAAAALFGALRDLDGKAPAIAVMPIPAAGLGEAINDRLRRAAAPREA
jgi:L-threonylcarbamoyladenylate synthase